MCPYGIIYNILHSLPWPTLVAQLSPYLQALRLRRDQKKAAKATRRHQ
jgi:hypothetical protein